MVRKLWLHIKERRMPWPLRVAGGVCRGFLRDPRKAIRLVWAVHVQMPSVCRYKLQIHGADFLRDLMEEASGLGMRPFLFWGTLLGLIRENAFMAHDYDIDTAITAADYAHKGALIDAMLKRGYRLRFDVPYSFSFETRDRLLHLDVDVVYLYQGKMVSSAFFEEEGRLSAHEFPLDVFEPLERSRFPGCTDVWLPSQPEKILECIYGRWQEPVTQYDFRTDPLNRVHGSEELRHAGPGPDPAR